MCYAASSSLKAYEYSALFGVKAAQTAKLVYLYLHSFKALFYKLLKTLRTRLILAVTYAYSARAQTKRSQILYKRFK